MEDPPVITDLQYAIYECGLTLDAAARRIGSTTTKLLEELAATPTPPWLREAARQWAESYGTAS